MVINLEQLDFIDIEQTDWREHVFSNPETTINIATLFSGIGAIEHSLKRLKLNHKVVILDSFFIGNKKNLKKIRNKITIVLGRNS